MTPTESSKLDHLLEVAEEAKRLMTSRARFVLGTLLIGILLLCVLISIGITNRQNGNLLVECTTPGSNPPPHTGNNCWDRLHDTTGTGDAIALIVDNIYCDHRRAQAKLPPVPDPRKSCREQTPNDVLGRP